MGLRLGYGALTCQRLAGSDRAGWIQVGTSEQLLDRLGSLADAFARHRTFELGVRLHYPGMERAEVLDTMARFAAEVLIPLRAAGG